MNRIIAAVKNEELLLNALETQVTTIFHLAANINSIAKDIEKVHSCNKKILVHMDMAEGLGKDKFGIKFLKDLGVDGIISTRANIIKAAKDLKLLTIQRFFIMDAQSVETTIETAKNSKPDMIEILPGIIPKIITKLKEKTEVPIIVGGLIETKEEAAAALKSGAFKISTGKAELWNVEE